MKIITEPTVTVISYPIFQEHPTYKIPEDGDDATKIGSFAAKTCYRSFGTDGKRSNRDNQRAIIESKHGRILEHINIGLHLEGISRALGNELITHKVGIVVSQESTRYVSMEDAGIVLEPFLTILYEKYKPYKELFGETGEGLWNVNHPTGDADWTDKEQEEIAILMGHIVSCEMSLLAYEDQYKMLMEEASYNLTGTAIRKWARGKARNVLPLALETKMVVTGNLRAWRHFIEMRSDRFAEAEIRRLADVIFMTMSKIAPLYFVDFKYEVIDGIQEWRTENRKV